MFLEIPYNQIEVKEESDNLLFGHLQTVSSQKDIANLNEHLKSMLNENDQLEMETSDFFKVIYKLGEKHKGGEVECLETIQWVRNFIKIELLESRRRYQFIRKICKKSCRTN